MKTWPTLYTKTSAGAINFWKIWTHGNEVFTKWGQVDTANPQQDSYTTLPKNLGKANATTAEEQAEKEAQARFEKQKRLKYVESIEAAENNLNIKPMRAYSWDEKRAQKAKWPMDCQPKYNGVRCMAYNLPDGSVRLMSRGGKDYTLPHIQEALKGKIPNGLCLDGEIYLHGTSLQSLRHYMETPGPETNKVYFVVYDFTSLPTNSDNWSIRLKNLKQWFEETWKDSGTQVRLSETHSVNSKAEVDSWHDKWVAQGFEGLMLRTLKGKYKLAGKSTDLLKFKKFQDAEFEVVGWTVGRDGVIVYKCLQEDGKTFDVRPVGSEEEREVLKLQGDANLGKKLTVKFQERSEDNIPIFPVGISFRPDSDLD